MLLLDHYEKTNVTKSNSIFDFSMEGNMATKSNPKTTNSESKLDQSTNNNTEAIKENQQKRMTLTPEQVQVLVMRQLNQVNTKKDELTIAIKQLGDLATQLSNICAQQNKALNKLKNDEEQ